MEKIKEILSFYFTPLIAAAGYYILEYLLKELGFSQFTPVIGLILGVVMAISTFINFSDYGMILKLLCPILCLVILVGSYNSLDGEGVSDSSGNGQISFGSSYKNCHYCNRGQKVCNSSYCLKGVCKSCDGLGIIDKGSYTITCRVCRGGICKQCGGTGYESCVVCEGTGKLPK